MQPGGRCAMIDKTVCIPRSEERAMDNNSYFNIAVCMMGILILLIHAVNVIIKKQKQQDDWILLDFFLFTIAHFAAYLTFTLLKARGSSDLLVMGFYTAFYIMNNLEVFLLFRYARAYIPMPSPTEKVLSALSYTVFSVYIALDIANIFTGIFFTAVDGVYTRSPTMILSQGYQFIMFAAILVVALGSPRLSVREKTAFGIYCVLPLVAILLQNRFPGFAIAYASIIVAIEVLILLISIEKNIVIAREREKNKEAQIRLMLSQIQPHFIYNSLSSISTLIAIDPAKAQAALDHFTEYLRHNLSSLTETRLIPFTSELRHIQSYVALEQMRFGSRLQVVYDIQADDFSVPPLTIQPIVENAIKHGVLKKLEGGTVTIAARETAEAYVVTIRDDGVGFDPAAMDSTGSHVGLRNIQYRIENTCRGKVSIDSRADAGTAVTVAFPKEVRV